MKVRLSKTVIEQAPYLGPGGCYLWDSQLAGFGVRIYPTGRKSFVAYYRIRGRQRFLTLGRFGPMTLQEARALALEALAKAQKGEDPSGERRKQKPRMSDLAEKHLSEHSAIHKKAKSVLKDRQLWEGRILPKLGRRRVADIERRDIARLLGDMASTPALANKARTLLSKAFNLAEMWGWRPDGSNPCRHLKRYEEQSRERYLSDSELARLGKVLDHAEQGWGTSPHALAAIRLLVLTGCRSGEILGLRWEDVDFERRCLHLPDSKTGKRTVVLNSGALQVLERIEQIEGNPHVIPGIKPGSHRSTLHNVWMRIRREAEIDDVRVHDLRHTFASYGVNAGHSLAIVGSLLGHRKILTTQRYAHVADDPVRQASEQIGSTLAATLQGKPLSDVKKLRSAN